MFKIKKRLSTVHFVYDKYAMQHTFRAPIHSFSTLKTYPCRLCSLFINELCYNRQNRNFSTLLFLIYTCISCLTRRFIFSMLYVVMQTELNSREGAWERLCMERDPLVLSGLMWSWLEQLKDPVISREEVKALCEKNLNPQNALGSLRKVAGLNICVKLTAITPFF